MNRNKQLTFSFGVDAGWKRRINAANALTCFRLLGAVLQIWIKPLSKTFYVIYSACGISDALDGPAARYFHTAGAFGARFDSAADLLFYSIMLIRLFPVLWKLLPFPVWIWIAGICALRLLDYTLAAVKFRRFAAMHTIWNKITGFLMFGVPYLVALPFFVVYSIILCAVATIGVLHALAVHMMTGTELYSE